MKKIVILFVEGDTDEAFFKGLLNYYRITSSKSLLQCDICNLSSVTRYVSKMKGILSGRYFTKSKKSEIDISAVFCSYDTDVFSDSVGDKAIVDWVQVRKSVSSLGIKNFYRIKVEQMIEDWLLDDMQSLCEYLRLPEDTKIPEGKDAFSRISRLFLNGGKMYLKGTAILKFSNKLNYKTIRDKRRDALKQFEISIGYRE